MTTDTVQPKTCTPIKRIIDVTVEIDPPTHCSWMLSGARESQEWYDNYAKALESWAKEFMDFVRDHRSQDECTIDVNKKYERFCSACNREWEEVPPDDQCPDATCSWCGVAVEREI